MKKLHLAVKIARLSSSFILATTLVTSTFAPVSVNAQMMGIPVFDGATWSQSVLNAIESVNQTLKQIEQYRTQLMQYENMIQNTIAPAAYIWDQAQRTIGLVMDEVNTITYYKNKLGDFDTYLSKFQNVNYYRSSPCFTPAGCSEVEWKAVNDVRALASESVKHATDALFKSVDVQQDFIKSDAQKVTQLQAAAQTAGGQMQALGYANQLAANQSHQLLQIRGLLVAQQNSAATIAQAEMNESAQQEAAARQLREGTFQPSPVRSWGFR